MMHIIFGIYIFLTLLLWCIFLDVIIAWLMLFGVKLRPKFISEILDPIYLFIRNIIPTQIGPIDFTPMIVMFCLYFLQGLIIMIFPQVLGFIQYLR